MNGKKIIRKVLSVVLSMAMIISMLYTGTFAPEKEVYAGSALGSADFLKTNGTQIRKNYGSGDVVYLRGTNAGGWLVQENWMNPTNACGGASLSLLDDGIALGGWSADRSDMI